MSESLQDVVFRLLSAEECGKMTVSMIVHLVRSEGTYPKASVAGVSSVLNWLHQEGTIQFGWTDYWGKGKTRRFWVHKPWMSELLETSTVAWDEAI